MVLAFCIIVGLVAGSFFNTVIYRLPRGQSLIDNWSCCPVCRARLQIVDLVPLIGYIALRGCCRSCRTRISPRYPLVELLTAAGFMIAYMRYSMSVSALAGCLFVSLLIICAFTDLETGIIPDLVTFPGIIAGFSLSFMTIGWQSSLLGSLAFGGALFITGVLSGGGMGGGDVKLGAAIGAFTGLKMGMAAFVLASLLGGLFFFTCKLY